MFFFIILTFAEAKAIFLALFFLMNLLYQKPCFYSLCECDYLELSVTENKLKTLYWG